jgi:hypothetical protein
VAAMFSIFGIILAALGVWLGMLRTQIMCTDLWTDLRTENISEISGQWFKKMSVFMNKIKLLMSHSNINNILIGLNQNMQEILIIGSRMETSYL